MTEQELNTLISPIRLFIEECGQIKGLPIFKQKQAKALALQRLENLKDKILSLGRAAHIETRSE